METSSTLCTPPTPPHLGLLAKHTKDLPAILLAEPLCHCLLTHPWLAMGPGQRPSSAPGLATLFQHPSQGGLDSSRVSKGMTPASQQAIELLWG